MTRPSRKQEIRVMVFIFLCLFAIFSLIKLGSFSLARYLMPEKMTAMGIAEQASQRTTRQEAPAATDRQTPRPIRPE